MTVPTEALFDSYFYYRVIRKLVTTFGTIFKDIQITRYKADGITEVERVVVPIIYAPKEKYLERITQDPNLTKAIQIQLPKLSFEITGIAYDATRKQQSLLSNYAVDPATNSTALRQYMSVPYDITFSLSAYVRNIEDGTQIAEQIFPIFNPDYTVPVIFDSANMNIHKELPIILESVSTTNDYEGSSDTMRMITWDFNFTMKAFFFGPTTNAAIIKKANTRIFSSSPQSDIEQTLLYMANTGFANYKVGEYVYQGDSIEVAYIKGIVRNWDNTNKLLTVSNISGTQGSPIFSVNTHLIGAVTGADYIVTTEYGAGIPAVIGYVQPKPLNANATDDFGFTTQIIEWPNDVYTH